MSELLRCENICRSFHDGEKELHVLNDVTFSADKGGIIGISGNSGSGKTTLLNILGLLDSANKGSIYISGEDVSCLSPSKKAVIRNRKIGFVFQEFFLIKEFSVCENVMIPALNRAGALQWFLRNKDTRKKAEAILAEVGLSERIDYNVRKLSGGEKQRVAIARAFINDPDMILCDEPTGNLDDDTEEGIKDLFSRLNKDLNKTFIIVSHNNSFLEICTTRLHLSHGKLVEGN